MPKTRKNAGGGAKHNASKPNKPIQNRAETKRKEAKPLASAKSNALLKAGDDQSSAEASPVRTRARNKLSQKPDGQLQSNAASTSRGFKEEESIDFSPSIDFKIPTKLPPELTLRMADSEKITTFWIEEQTNIKKSFSWFVGQPYFLNKFGFLQVLLKKYGLVLMTRYAIFLPSGCGKTVMSMALEHFYSKDKDHNTTQHLYSPFLNDEQLTHAGKYFVLRMSFRNFEYNPNQSFETTMIKFLEDLIIHVEPEIENEDVFEEGDCIGHIVHKMVRFLYRKHGKMVVIIDEVDTPAVMYSIKNATPKQIGEMTNTFKSFLTSFADCTYGHKINYIRQVILFGIHQPDGIFKSLTWAILDITDKEICAPYFLFNMTEITTLLTKFGLNDKLSEVEKHYGNYNGQYFLPASVVAFLINGGQFKMYKAIRRSYDILNLNIPWVERTLLEFLDNKTHRKRLDSDQIHFGRHRIMEDNPLMQYIFAGLICIKLPANDLNKNSSDVESTGASETANNDGNFDLMADDRFYFDFKAEYELFAGNLENLNIIQFFVEKAAGNAGISSNPNVLNEIYNALLRFDFEKLTSLLNDMYSTSLHLELVNERAFHVAMKVFFYFVPVWKTQTEVELCTVNRKSGASGRTGMRIFNEKERILYILVLKHVKPKQELVPLVDDREVQKKLDEAFQQIIDEGYVLKTDEDNFEHIFEVAVACRGKVIIMKSRKHEPKPEPEPPTPLT